MSVKDIRNDCDAVEDTRCVGMIECGGHSQFVVKRYNTKTKLTAYRNIQILETKLFSIASLFFTRRKQKFVEENYPYYTAILYTNYIKKIYKINCYIAQYVYLYMCKASIVFVQPANNILTLNGVFTSKLILFFW